jgi:hypothetical protein
LNKHLEYFGYDIQIKRRLLDTLGSSISSNCK